MELMKWNEMEWNGMESMELMTWNEMEWNPGNGIRGLRLSGRGSDTYFGAPEAHSSR